MAITTTTISKSAGYAATDVILQLEEAFTWLGWHGNTVSGIVTGISAYSGGGTVGSATTYYYDVPVATTSGIGTGASFYVWRSGGIIQNVFVNRPGVGYTNGEYVTLSAADIGGGGAVAIGLTVQVAGGSSPVGYGTTTAFFDKDVTAGISAPWGVVRHTIQPNKKFGDTYRGIQASTTTLSISQGSSFHPWDSSNFNDRGNQYANRFAGNTLFDTSLYDPISFSSDYTTTSGPAYSNSVTISNSNSYQLDLNIYRSGIDPKFAVFAYKQPTLSSTAIDDNNFEVFFFHNFTTPIWDLDYVFLGGFTRIVPQASPTTQPKIVFTTYLANDTYTKRSAEWGYSNGGSNYIKYTNYESSQYSQESSSDMSFYIRNATNSTGGFNGFETLNSNTFYNAVIKGIPLSAQIAPCPYYLPDDFVLIDFDYGVPSANIQQGDTITISGSEVYTVITGSYHQTTRTRGILFCARTV